MKSLPNRELNDVEIYGALLKGKIDTGAEATICESDKSYSVYKIFTENGRILHMGTNKEEKINMLYQKDLDFSTKILSTISYHGFLVGYEMSYDEDLISHPEYKLVVDKQELLYFLRKSKEILEYFKENDILYGDVACRNILFNRVTGEMAFCDMDNVKIGYHQIDTMPMDLFDYEDRRGIDYGVHPYMHNKMLLNMIGYDEFCADPYLFKKYLKLCTRNTIASMIKPEEFDEKYLIDYVRKLK